MEIKKNDLFPCQLLSEDHYQSAVPGRTYSSKGSYHPKNMFNGCTIFVDHVSGKIFLNHQESLSAYDSIKFMLRREREAAESGVKVLFLHTDNGTFSSTEFMAYLASKKQPVTFSGVGTAHQNAVAERAIQTMTYMARIMLIHAAMRSPSDTITTNHWPMAMVYAAWVYNNLPKQDSARFEVNLDNQDDPELADEWLTEGEALVRSNAQRERILKDSVSPEQSSTSPSQLEEDSFEPSPQPEREDASDSNHLIKEEDKEIPSTNIDGDVTPSSPFREEKEDSLAAPESEGADLETGPMRFSQSPLQMGRGSSNSHVLRHGRQ
eukprot:516140-Ditylum_brightwellii.AAC.2